MTHARKDTEDESFHRIRPTAPGTGETLGGRAFRHASRKEAGPCAPRPARRSSSSALPGPARHCSTARWPCTRTRRGSATTSAGCPRCPRSRSSTGSRAGCRSPLARVVRRGGRQRLPLRGPAELLERVFPQPVEGEPVFAHRGVGESGPTPTPDARQARLAGDLRRAVRASGGKVLVSKRIGHNRRIPLLHGIVPDARFVVVTRDGRAVARSLAKVNWWPESHIWWYGGTPLDWAAEGRDPVELCARHWVREVEAVTAGVASIPDHLVLAVRYEEIVGDPRRVLGGGRHLRRPRAGPGVGGVAGAARLLRQERRCARRARRAVPGAAAARAGVPHMTRPVFVLGTGRCGSTLVHEVLARHEDTGFVTNLDDLGLRTSSRWQNDLWRRLPAEVTKKGGARFAPSEAYRVLAKEVGPLVVDPVRDLTAADATPWLRSRMTGLRRPPHRAARRPRSSSTSSPAGRGRGSSVPASPTRSSSRWSATAGAWPTPGSRCPGGTATAARPSGSSARSPPSASSSWEAHGRSFPVLAALAWQLLVEAHDEARADCRRTSGCGSATRTSSPTRAAAHRGPRPPGARLDPTVRDRLRPLRLRLRADRGVPARPRGGRRRRDGGRSRGLPHAPWVLTATRRPGRPSRPSRPARPPARPGPPTRAAARCRRRRRRSPRAGRRARRTARAPSRS